MATQAQIQSFIDEIKTRSNYPATKMNNLLSLMLDFASAGQTQVFDGLVADDTTAATTLVLEYGVNIIDTSTITDFACRLPQPVTGKKVIVVNSSNFPVSLFPSNVGGQINNYPVDTPAIIPPDGRAYDFICIENPLPGAWVWSPPAINQFDSGEISATTTSNAANRYIAAATLGVGGPTFAAEKDSFNSSNGIAYDGLNQPNIFEVNLGPIPNTLYLTQFKPLTPINVVTKIKVYTNIIHDPAVGLPGLQFLAGQQLNEYVAGTNTFVTNGIGDAASPYFNNFNLSNQLSGGGSPGVTTNIGDAGTSWGEITVTPSMFNYGQMPPSSKIGDLFISTDGTTDIWLTRVLTAYFRPRMVGLVKFRFFIEYF
jgi:hypothetical protein